MNELTVIPKEDAVVLTRRASDVAGLCKEIVLKTSLSIQGRKYVRVEGWQSIATAHGCVAGCRDVEKVQGGFRAIGELRRSDGAVIATAEGFVGEDEPTWFGGISPSGKTLPKRPDYAIRAMCQTRAISRVCRSAFAHVVVLMDANLSTTPAEEVPDEGFEPHRTVAATTPQRPPPAANTFEQTVDENHPNRATETKTAQPVADLTNATICDCILESFKEVNSKPDAPKPWVAWFCKFESQGGQQFEAGTFDKKIGEKLDVLQGQEVTLTYKPGKKPGSFEIITIEILDNIP